MLEYAEFFNHTIHERYAENRLTVLFGYRILHNFTLKILALDASTEYLSLALWLDGKVESLDMHAGQTHSQIILPKIRELLDASNLQMRDINGIAFGEGPGSFTGLRISCGVAQGLAFGANIPVVAVSTLLSLAHASGRDKVIACLDARMGEVYFAAYENSAEGWKEISAPGLYKPESLPALPSDGWVGVGSGWDAYAEPLQSAYQSQLAECLTGKYPSASAMAELSVSRFEAGLGLPAAQAAPVYIRNKVAFTSSEREKSST